MRAWDRKAVVEWEPEPSLVDASRTQSFPHQLQNLQRPGIRPKQAWLAFLIIAGGHPSWKQQSCQGEATPEDAIMLWKAGANQLCLVCPWGRGSRHLNKIMLLLGSSWRCLKKEHFCVFPEWSGKDFSFFEGTYSDQSVFLGQGFCVLYFSQRKPKFSKRWPTAQKCSLPAEQVFFSCFHYVQLLSVFFHINLKNIFVNLLSSICFLNISFSFQLSNFFSL